MVSKPIMTYIDRPNKEKEKRKRNKEKGIKKKELTLCSWIYVAYISIMLAKHDAHVKLICILTFH